MAQGKPWNKEKIIEAIEPYLKLGYSVNKACILAKIPTSTVATWMEKDDSLRKKFESWQNMVSAKARETIARSINKGDKQDAKWWLERREKKDFSTQQIIGGDGEDGQLRIVIERYNEKDMETNSKATRSVEDTE
jgi:hypothetical protein